MDLVSNNCDFLSLVSKLMGQIRKESAQFLISLPSRLDAKSKEASESPNKSNSKANAVDKTYLETWLLDRFYFDQADKSTVSVVERVCYLKEENGDEESKSQCRYGLEVLASDSIAQASTLLCDGMQLIESMLVSEAKGDTPFHCAASWALACLSLDAFCTKLSKFESNAESPVGNGMTAMRQRLVKRKLSYISSTASEDDEDALATSYPLAHISSKLAIALLDEGETSSESKKGDTEPPPKNDSFDI